MNEFIWCFALAFLGGVAFHYGQKRKREKGKTTPTASATKRGSATSHEAGIPGRVENAGEAAFAGNPETRTDGAQGNPLLECLNEEPPATDVGMAEPPAGPVGTAKQSTLKRVVVVLWKIIVWILKNSSKIAGDYSYDKMVR